MGLGEKGLLLLSALKVIETGLEQKKRGNSGREKARANCEQQRSAYAERKPGSGGVLGGRVIPAGSKEKELGRALMRGHKLYKLAGKNSGRENGKSYEEHCRGESQS